MTLPLMPGDEPINIKYAQDKPKFNVRSWETTYGGAGFQGRPTALIPGCTCPICTGEPITHLDLAAQQELAQYETTPPRPGLVRGAYRFIGVPSPDLSLNGTVRWLDPATGRVYDSNGMPQWQFQYRDGAWVDEALNARGPGYYGWIPDVPEHRPVAQQFIHPETGRIRGRYVQPATYLEDEIRWLDAATGALYDDGGLRVNTISRDGDNWGRGPFRWEPY